MANLRLLVADDHEVTRRGVRRLLDEQPGWEVVAEAASGREAAEQAKLLRPDIIILDLMMPEMNGLEAAREILKSVPAKILILSAFDSDSLIQQSLLAGARGFLLKSDAAHELVSAVDALRRDKTYFTPKVREMILDGFLERPPGLERDAGRQPRARLTARQIEILRMLAEGMSSGEIGAALRISTKTAETHRANIMRRLNCHSAADLVRYAVRNNLIKP